MIKFKFTSTKKADSDGQYGLRFDVIEQDELQTAKGLGVYSFQASNGWAVKSNKAPNLEIEDKTVWIAGSVKTEDVLGLIQVQSDINWFDTEAEMFSVMKDVSEAIAEWAKAGGFPQVSEYDVKEFSL